jgi:hypothetical protein
VRRDALPGHQHRCRWWHHLLPLLLLLVLVVPLLVVVAAVQKSAPWPIFDA